MVNVLLWACLVEVALLRFLVVVRFCFKVEHPFTVKHVDALPHAGESQNERRQRHEEFYDQTAQQFNTLVLVGSIALASWSQLFASSSGGLTSLTKNLLLFSSAALLVAPLLFRRPSREFSFLCREGLTVVGYTALVISLASVFSDLFCTVGSVIASLAAVAIGVRDLGQGWRLLEMWR